MRMLPLLLIDQQWRDSLAFFSLLRAFSRAFVLFPSIDQNPAGLQARLVRLLFARVPPLHVAEEITDRALRLFLILA